MQLVSVGPTWRTTARYCAQARTAASMVAITAPEIVQIGAAADRVLLPVRPGKGLRSAHAHFLAVGSGERSRLAGDVSARPVGCPGHRIAEIGIRILPRAVIQRASGAGAHGADRSAAAGLCRTFGIGRPTAVTVTRLSAIAAC